MKFVRRNFCVLAIAAGFVCSINLTQGQSWGQTSPSDPLVFWVNNNYDRSVKSSDDGTNIDDDVKIADCPYTPHVPTPDYNYRDATGRRVIPCKRDLLDFTSLWLLGVTSNLLTQLSPGSTVTLNWGDVGNPNPANPTIDLFIAADSGTGTAYLTNDAIATKQIDPVQCPYVGRLGPGGSIQLNTLQFSNRWAGNSLIWCGVSNGAGGINMTFTDGNGNTMATATAYIQIVDIKQMYERWTVGDNPTRAPTNTPILVTDSLGPGVQGFRYTQPQDTNTPYILFVHGWNLEPWEKDRYAESAFKRLYWQGYNGRFGEFRWPTHYDFGGIGSGAKNTPLNDPRNFDDSESNAWRSATGLLNKLNDLNVQYPGNVYLMAHSMGNVVAGEALRKAGTTPVVNTYIALQGAVPSHCYDPTTTTRSLGIFDDHTPNCYAHYWTSNAPCYFNGTAGAATYRNFYNTNDYALNYWTLDQNTKPDTSANYGWDGTNFFQGITFPNMESPLFFPVDTYEIFAYCDEARCYALGAQVGVTGFSQKDLQSVWPPDPLANNNYSSHFWHSAEFRGDYPQQVNFWATVLGQNGFGLK